MMNLAASTLALLVVLALAYYVIKAGAKLSGLKQSGNGIRVIETTAVGSRERLVVVSYNNERYLLGVTAHTVNVIDQHQHTEADVVSICQSTNVVPNANT